MPRVLLAALAVALTLAACAAPRREVERGAAAVFDAVTITPTLPPTPPPDTPTPAPPAPPTRAPAAAPTPTAPAAAASANLIHAVDWRRVVAAELQIDGAAGSVEPESVVYADLTGDGADEAIVPLATGGTAGVLGYYVFGMQGGRLVRLLTSQTPDVSVGVAGGRLVETAAVFALNDPRCCPSLIRRTFYRWNGSGLVPEASTIMPNPDR